MANEQRLVDANVFIRDLTAMKSVYDAIALDGMIKALKEAPTVDAVPVNDLKEFASDVAYQFGYYCNTGGRLCLSHGGLSTLEWAFDILGWDNLHPVPECECEIDGCHEHATCGALTADGYKRMCGNHCRERANR